MFPQDPCDQSEFSSDQDCVLVKGRLRRAVGLLREIHPPPPGGFVSKWLHVFL